MKEADITEINTAADEIELPNDAPNERIIGKIFHLDTENGFGFITSMSKRFSRIYFHWTQLMPGVEFLELKKHDQLSFICVRHVDKEGIDKGWRAIRIERA